MSNLGGWFKDNQVLVIALVGQAIVAGIYMVNLEARVSTLETRGSVHLVAIDNRLTEMETQLKTMRGSLDRVLDKLTK